MIESGSAKQKYKYFEIHHIGLVRGWDKPVNGLGKTGQNGCLDRLIDTHIDETKVVERVDRVAQCPLTLK